MSCNNIKTGALPIQKGAALLVCLMLLLIITLVSLGSIRTSKLQEKMVGNLRDKQIAFEAAEAGLVGAEEYLKNQITTLGGFDGDGSDGLYDETFQNIWDSVDWAGGDSNNTNKALAYDGFSTSQGVASRPKFVIQHFATYDTAQENTNLSNYGGGTGGGSIEYFKVTVRATGGSASSHVTLQSTFGKIL